MSLQTIHQAANDQALLDRIVAATNKEAIANVELGATAFGQLVRKNQADIRATFAFPVAVDYEAEYASAVAADNPNPGGDPTVITDANVSAAVQVHWPPDPEAPA